MAYIHPPWFKLLIGTNTQLNGGTLYRKPTMFQTMGSITGIIRNANDAPVEDVNVVIISGPTHNDIAALTGADGQFSFTGIQPGDYVIKAFGQLESPEIQVQVQTHHEPFVEVWLNDDDGPEDDNG